MLLIFAAYCHFKECCEPKWTSKDVSDIGTNLKENVFGQHLVLDIVPKLIKEHKKDANPQKPLVLSFHGTTGTGKNYVSGILTEHLYPEGFDSKYVIRIISSHEFPNKDRLEEYKQDIKKILIRGIKNCPNALFIVDEVDKMPPGLADTLKPYLDYNDKVDGYDFRKAIFIFMGNTGVDEINEVALNFFRDGEKREKITMKSMNKLLKAVAFNSGGLKKAKIIDHHLIDFHVPFLPLERKHVRMCAEVEFKRAGKHVNSERLDAVADELEYFPKGENVYSVSGCKNVKRLVQVMF